MPLQHIEITIKQPKRGFTFFPSIGVQWPAPTSLRRVRQAASSQPATRYSAASLLPKAENLMITHKRS